MKPKSDPPNDPIRKRLKHPSSGRPIDNQYENVKPFSPVYQPKSYGSIHSEVGSSRRTEVQPRSIKEPKSRLRKKKSNRSRSKTKPKSPKEFFNSNRSNKNHHEMSQGREGTENQGSDKSEPRMEQDEIGEIIEYLLEGKSLDWIAKHMGIDISRMIALIREMELRSSEHNFEFYDQLKTQAIDQWIRDKEKLFRTTPQVLFSSFEDQLSEKPLDRIVKISEYTGSDKILLLKPSKNSTEQSMNQSTDFGIIKTKINVLDLHSEILAKLAFYAKYNPIVSKKTEVMEFKDGIIGRFKIRRKMVNVTVSDLLGEAAYDMDMYNLLGKWFQSNGSDYNFAAFTNSQIHDIDPELRYVIETEPRSLLGEMHDSTLDYERIEHIWIETGMLALLVAGKLNSGILETAKIPISPALSRLFFENEERVGFTTWNATGVASDLLFSYNHYDRLPQGTFLQGSVEKKHRSFNKTFTNGKHAASLSRSIRQSLSYGQADDGTISMKEKLEMGTIIERYGDRNLKNEKLRFPSRYPIEMSFGIMDMSRIGNDLRAHFGITNKATDPSQFMLWSSVGNNDIPSNMMIVAAYNSNEKDTTLHLGKSHDAILTTNQKELGDLVVTIKRRLNPTKVGKPGMNSPIFDKWISNTPIFEAALNIKNLFETRIQENLLFEALYTGRVWNPAAFTMDSIPAVNRGKSVLSQLNLKLRRRWAKAYGKPLANTPKILIYNDLISTDQRGVKINPISKIQLELYPGLRNESINIRKTRPRIISVNVSEFWFVNPSTGLLGIQHPDFSYYTVAPEDFTRWMEYVPARLPLDTTDGTNEQREEWYSIKIQELISKKGKNGSTIDGAWTTLMNTKIQYLENIKLFGKEAPEVQIAYQGLVKARRIFMKNAPTEGVLRELQQDLLRKLIRNELGGLKSSYSLTQPLIYKPFTRSLILLGSGSLQQIGEIMTKMDPGLSTLTMWDYIGFSTTSKSRSDDNTGGTADRDDQIMAVSGNIVKVAHTPRIDKMDNFRELVDYLVDNFGSWMYRLLNPHVKTSPSVGQIEALKYYLKRTNGKYSRLYNQNDFDLTTRKKANADGKIMDGRFLSTLVMDEKTRKRMFHGLDKFLEETFDLSGGDKKYQISFTSEANTVLRRYLNVHRTNRKGKLIDQKPVPVTEVIDKKTWREIIESRKSFTDAYIANNGIIYDFSWVSKEADGKNYELDRLSYYFFGNNKGIIDFKSLRGRGYTKGKLTNANFYPNTKEIGVLWYLIIDNILQNFNEIPRVRSESTLNALSDVGTANDPKLPWIVKKVDGSWDVGARYHKLVDDVEPKDYATWMAAHRIIDAAAEEIESLDKTGWMGMARAWEGIGTGKKYPTWIKRELDGLPSNDREIQRLKQAKIEFTFQQLEAVRLGFLYIVDTLEKFVGPSTQKLNDLWKLDRTPSIDHGYTNGAPLMPIIDKKQADFLKKFLDMLLVNNFDMPKKFKSVLQE